MLENANSTPNDPAIKAIAYPLRKLNLKPDSKPYAAACSNFS